MPPQITKANRENAKQRGEPGTRKKSPVLPFLLTAIVAIIVVVYFALSGGLPFGGRPSAARIKELLTALNPQDMNILFITLDTTRADHIGCYGYSGIETPNIDRLAGEGFLFRNATSQAPLTLPSHSSIFTGTYPLYHGVRDNGGFYLEADKTTLATVLKKAGWATSAFIGAFVLDSRWGLNQGFDHYYDNFDFSKYKTITLDSVQREGGEVVKAFFDWFATNGQKKFFSWLHFYDPHTPYEPPEPYKTKYGNQPWGLYDGEIAYVDTLIGRVEDELKKAGVLDKTLIVIVGDHGESLGQHHESGHGFFIYDATTSVPLIVKIPAPRLRGQTIWDQVENADIMPTLLELLGLSIPEQVQGRSFLPLLAGKSDGPERLAYSETFYPRYHYGWSELKSLRTTRFKFIQAPRPELYDLSQDPGEKTNIFAASSGLGKRFTRELQRLQKERSAKEVDQKGPQKLDNDAREKLMALGYIGGFTSNSKMTQTGNLGDPKDKIILYNKIKQAEGNSANREYDDALKLLGEVIAEDPGIMEARQVRANIYLELNRPEDAIAESREALKVDEEYEAAIFIMAQAYKKLKKYDEAIAGYNRIMELDPKDPKPYANLGEIYCETKEFDKAIASLEKAISIDSEHSATSHNLLGLAYLEQKMLDQAEKEITLSIKMRPRIPDAHYHLGLLYEEKGDINRAIEEYKKEIEIHPAAYPARFNLSLVYAKLGRPQDAVAELKETINSNEKFARGYLFLAKAYLDLNENFNEAISLARKGLEIDPESESAPLGHYVLADIFNRLGRMNEYLAEVEKGRALEAKLKRKT